MQAQQHGFNKHVFYYFHRLTSGDVDLAAANPAGSSAHEPNGEMDMKDERGPTAM